VEEDIGLSVGAARIAGQDRLMWRMLRPSAGQAQQRVSEWVEDSDMNWLYNLAVGGLIDRWSDIRGFSRNRKLFGIDTTLSVKPFQFQLVSFVFSIITSCYVFALVCYLLDLCLWLLKS